MRSGPPIQKQKSMSKRDLKLNSPSRYSKESPQYVLEEHGHCEVPAGCGGVVLRWTNPHRAIPVQFWIYTRGESRLYLDGKRTSSGRPMVAYGDVLGLRIENADASSGLLMFAAFYDVEETIHKNRSRKGRQKKYVLSADDGSWKYTEKEPDGDAWMLPGFDDSAWRTMTISSLPEPGELDPGEYRYRRLQKAGARGLTVPVAGDPIWVRKAFSISQV